MKPLSCSLVTIFALTIGKLEPIIKTNPIEPLIVTPASDALIDESSYINVIVAIEK